MAARADAPPAVASRGTTMDVRENRDHSDLKVCFPTTLTRWTGIHVVLWPCERDQAEFQLPSPRWEVNRDFRPTPQEAQQQQQQPTWPVSNMLTMYRPKSRCSHRMSESDPCNTCTAERRSNVHASRTQVQGPASRPLRTPYAC